MDGGKLSDVNARTESRRQNELVSKFKMAESDLVSIRWRIKICENTVKMAPHHFWSIKNWVSRNISIKFPALLVYLCLSSGDIIFSVRVSPFYSYFYAIRTSAFSFSTWSKHKKYCRPPVIHLGYGGNTIHF